jgi:hypothetical protein
MATPDRQYTSNMIRPPYPPPSPRPSSSVYSDDAPDINTMTYLHHMVSEELTEQEHQLIATYESENRMLEEELALHREAWNGTIMLANTVIRAVAIIKKSQVTFDKVVEDAEKDWLAFWGIYKECLGSHPPWI